MVPDSAFVQSVQPQGMETYNNIDRSTPENFGGQVGQALNQAGDMLQQNAMQRQQFANETAVNDVYVNQFSPAARNILQNYMKLEGKDAEARFPEFQQQMNDLRTQIRSNLPNMMQQRSFDDASTRRVEMDLSGMARYGAQQTKAWEWNTHTAVMADLVNEAEANWNNPQRLQNVRDRMDAETADYGSKHGWSGDVFRYQLGVNNDKLWGAVIKRQALSGDLTGAMKTYDDQVSAGRISGSAQTALEMFFKPIRDLQSAQNAYGKVTGGQTAQAIAGEAQRQGVDPGTALTIWSAEGGVTNPATMNPQSSATGIFQHTAGTWADLGGTDQDRLDAGRQVQLGVALAKQNTAALAKDLGRQPQPWQVYLAHQQGIAGATALLHADPNASAAGVLGGNTEKLTPNGMPVDATASQALDCIRNYVDKHTQMYEPNGVPSAQNITQNYEQHMQRLADQARLDYPGDPTAPERYQKNYAQQAGRQLHTQQMSDQANRRMLDNSLTGPAPVKSWQEFMSDPARVDAYNSAFKNDGTVYDRVDKAITTNALAAWDPSATAETTALYNQLNGMKNADRDNFATMDLNPYYGAMPASQYYDLVKNQQKIQDKDAVEAEKHVQLTYALTSIKPLVKLAAATPDSPYFGMDPHYFSGLPLHPETASAMLQVRARSFVRAAPDSGIPAGQKKYNDFVGAFGNALDTWRQNNQGKVPGDTDVRGVARDILFPPEVLTPAGQTVREAKSAAADMAEKPEIPPEASK